MKPIIALLLAGCASSTGPCTPAERAAIGAKYVASLEAACEHGKPLSECPSAPELTKQYEAERERWTLCSRK